MRAQAGNEVDDAAVDDIKLHGLGTTIFTMARPERIADGENTKSEALINQGSAPPRVPPSKIEPQGLRHISMWNHVMRLTRRETSPVIPPGD